MSEVPGHRRDAEQDAVGGSLDGLAVGHELEQTDSFCQFDMVVE